MVRHIYSTIIRYLALVSIIFGIMPLAGRNIALFAELLAIVVLLNFNDLFRHRRLRRQTVTYAISFLFSLLCLGSLAFFQDNNGVEIYVIYLLVELIVIHDRLPIFLIAAHFTMIFVVDWIQTDLMHALRHELLSYSLALLTILLFRNLMIEKRRVEGLNQELQESNRKLEDYSKQIETLTITKERTRIAQELHDSMGHALVALNMNLEYAEKVVDKKPTEIKAVLGKMRELTKQSMMNLRQAVKLLKDDDTVPDLREALQTLFDAFQENHHIHFDLNLDIPDKWVDSSMTNCLYKTVREGITNGFKHGGASSFTITIASQVNKIILNMTNNGMTGSEIVKSNGLKGIENRFQALGGSVHFQSSKESGFTIKGSLPVRGSV
ncbi:MAG: sensor histidine kinase [Sporolactobacillus sp.]